MGYTCVWHDFELSVNFPDVCKPGVFGKGGQNFCDFVAENAMLRITVEESPVEEKWILQGQLTGDFASELRANWRVSLDRCSDRSRVVDLSDVTVIDKSGEEVLLEMIHQRARFVATGIYTRHLLKELQARINTECKAD